MTSFLNSADSRNTSPELMAAIFYVSGRSRTKAEQIWADGPTGAELTAIVEIVTNNGMRDTAEFCWGEAGSNWEAELS